ncbi:MULTISPECIES: PAS domain-containing protein [Paenibacillus]|uniref:PAS domain-containing protein n=1 Tax=Paenibacillus TaxID=44249 RepID=UPI001E5A0B55|nr:MULTISPECIES: PAS domain-containing protein [Paenibacillus]
MPNTVTSWSHAVHSLNKGLIILRADGTIDNINDPLMKWPAKFGMSPKHLQPGISFFDVSPPEFDSSFALFYREFFLPAIREVLLGHKEAFSVEYELEGEDGPAWVLCEVQPIASTGNKLVLGAVLSYSDITKYKHTELQLAHLLSYSAALPEHVPICAVCKHVHTEDVWEPVESYLEIRLPIKFTHDICPGCIRRLYPQYSSAFDDAELPDNEEP